MRLEDIAGPMLDDVMTALAASSLGRTVKNVEMPPMPPEMMGLPPELGGMPPEMGGMPPEMMGMPMGAGPPPQAMVAGPPGGGAPIGQQEQMLRDMIAQQAMQGSEPIGPLPAMPASPYEAM